MAQRAKEKREDWPRAVKYLFTTSSNTQHVVEITDTGGLDDSLPVVMSYLSVYSGIYYGRRSDIADWLLEGRLTPLHDPSDILKEML